MKNVIGLLFAFFSLSSVSFAAVNVQPGAYCQLNDELTLHVGAPSVAGYGYHKVDVSGSVFKGAAFDGRDLDPSLTKSVQIRNYKGRIWLSFVVYQDSFAPFGKMFLGQVADDQYELIYEHDRITEFPLSQYVNCTGLTAQ